jgi:hypothetical protein
MILSIIMRHKANKNIRPYLKRWLLKQSIDSRSAAQFIQANAKKTGLKGFYRTLMMLLNKVTNMISPSTLFSPRWSRLKHCNQIMTMTSRRQY